MGGTCNTHGAEVCNTKSVWEEITEAHLKDIGVDDQDNANKYLSSVSVM